MDQTKEYTNATPNTKHFVFKITSILTFSLLLGACVANFGVIGAQTVLRCEVPELGCKWKERIDGQFDKSALTTEQIEQFNPALLYIETASSNILPTFPQTTANVSLKDGYNIVSSHSFSLYRSGNRYYLSDPYSVKSWLLSHAEAFDTIEIELPNMDFAQQTGNNNVVIEAFYNDELIGGGSFSAYLGSNNCTNCIQQ